MLSWTSDPCPLHLAPHLIVFSALSVRLRSEGKRIGEFDEVIAAVALDSIREMVARDGNFREVAGLVVEG